MSFINHSWPLATEKGSLKAFESKKPKNKKGEYIVQVDTLTPLDIST